MIINMNENQPNEKIQEILRLVEDLTPEEKDELYAVILEPILKQAVHDMQTGENYAEDDEFESSVDSDFNGLFPKTLPRDNVKKYTLRVTLKGLKPAIFRKFEVPSNITLRNLGELIINLMGWSGYHLQQFRVYDRCYSPEWQGKDKGWDYFSDSERDFKSEEYTVSDVLTEKGKSIMFEYDFGDGWQHEVKLSSIADYQQNEAHAVRFIDGRRACPIEDCGGIWGYEALCAHFYGDKSFDEEYEKEFFDSYIDEDFDPEYFDFQDAHEICKVYSEEILREEL